MKCEPNLACFFLEELTVNYGDVLIRLSDALVELIRDSQTLPLVLLAALLAWAIHRMAPK
jgi:hypothetical protein